MKTQFVADDKVILGLQGLRFIKKVDRSGAGWPEKYELIFSYKGKDDSQNYQFKKDRDAMYDKVKAILTKEEEK